MVLLCCVYSSLPRVSVDLTPESFRSQVLSGQDHWILDFYAPWCGPCQHFAPEFEVLARVSHLFLFYWITLVSDNDYFTLQPKAVIRNWTPIDVLCVIDRFLRVRFEQGRWTVRLIKGPVNQQESPLTQLSDSTHTWEKRGWRSWWYLKLWWYIYTQTYGFMDCVCVLTAWTKWRTHQYPWCQWDRWHRQTTNATAVATITKQTKGNSVQCSVV